MMPFGGYNPLDDGEYEDFSPWFKPEVKENKMKLAWLCYDYDEWLKAGPHNGYVAVPKIRFEEPSPYMYHRIIPIVWDYAVLENKMNEVDLTKVQLVWTQDILTRIKTILDSKVWTEDQKLVSIAWLVKQGLKRDDD
jgi:hypothetical protein